MSPSPDLGKARPSYWSEVRRTTRSGAWSAQSIGGLVARGLICVTRHNLHVLESDLRAPSNGSWAGGVWLH
jgi:hypothetical protein